MKTNGFRASAADRAAGPSANPRGQLQSDSESEICFLDSRSNSEVPLDYSAGSSASSQLLGPNLDNPHSEPSAETPTAAERARSGGAQGVQAIDTVISAIRGFHAGSGASSSGCRASERSGSKEGGGAGSVKRRSAGKAGGIDCGEGVGGDIAGASSRDAERMKQSRSQAETATEGVECLTTTTARHQQPQLQPQVKPREQAQPPQPQPQLLSQGPLHALPEWAQPQPHIQMQPSPQSQQPMALIRGALDLLFSSLCCPAAKGVVATDAPNIRGSAGESSTLRSTVDCAEEEEECVIAPPGMCLLQP